MLQDRQGIPAGFALHRSLADLVLPPQRKKAALLPSAGSGILGAIDGLSMTEIKESNPRK